MTLNPEQLLTFSPLHRLQWEEVQQKTVILYPEGMVELNQSSAEILKLCDKKLIDSLIIRSTIGISIRNNGYTN